jgi:hypothetical protein
MATTDAATTAVVLRRVEEEHGRAGRVLAHRHLRAAQGSPAVSGATSAFARRRDLQALRAALDPAIVWQGLRDDLSCHGANEVVAGFVAARDEGYDIDALELIPSPRHVVLGVRRAELREIDRHRAAR